MYTGGHALESATCWVILKAKVAAYRKWLGRFIPVPSSCLTTCTLKGSSASCSVAGGILQVWQADQQVSPNTLCFRVWAFSAWMQCNKDIYDQMIKQQYSENVSSCHASSQSNHTPSSFDYYFTVSSWRGEDKHLPRAAIFLWLPFSQSDAMTNSTTLFQGRQVWRCIK